jgi:hypothetical protein
LAKLIAKEWTSMSPGAKQVKAFTLFMFNSNTDFNSLIIFSITKEYVYSADLNRKEKMKSLEKLFADFSLDETNSFKQQQVEKRNLARKKLASKRRRRVNRKVTFVLY